MLTARTTRHTLAAPFAGTALPSNPQGSALSIQNIRLFGDPVLRTPAEPVVDFDRELRQLVKDLTETMVDAPGAGLAAPQIGVGLRVFTYWVDGELGHLVNPDLDLSTELQEGEEGCLSFPGLRFETPRALRTVAKGFNQFGEPVVVEGSELLARCLQHETDHLDGILFIDRMDREQRKAAMRAIREADWTGGLGSGRQGQSRTPPSAGACDAAGLRRHPRSCGSLARCAGRVAARGRGRRHPPGRPSRARSRGRDVAGAPAGRGARHRGADPGPPA